MDSSWNNALIAPNHLADPARRRFLARSAALGLGSTALLGGAPRPAAAVESEVLTITPELIAAAKKEGTLVVRFSDPVDEMTALSKAFDARFGIKVNMDRKVGALGNQQMLTEERANRHFVDVNYSSDPSGIIDIIKEGYYLNFTLPDLQSKVQASTYMPGYAYGMSWEDIVISYNPDLLPHARAKELLKTWDGLLDPSLKGKFGMNEPGGGGVPFAVNLMFYRHSQYGPEFLSKMAAQNPRLYPGSAQGREDLAAGAIAVFISNWEAVVMSEFMAGSKMAWTYPEISPALSQPYLCISKNAPHGNAARLFVAWFFTPEGANVLQGLGLRPTLKDIPDMRAAVAKLKQTDWWTPFPEQTRWVPDNDDWIANYAKLLPEMRKTLGWH